MMSDSANQLNQASQIRIVTQCNRLRESILNWLGSGNVPANMSVKYRKLVFSNIWLAKQNERRMKKLVELTVKYDVQLQVHTMNLINHYTRLFHRPVLITKHKHTVLRTYLSC